MTALAVSASAPRSQFFRDWGKLMGQSAPRYRAALKTIGWSQRHVAIPLGCTSRLTRAWARDDAKEECPKAVLLWLENLADYHEKLPVPQDWRRQGRRPVPIHEEVTSLTRTIDKS
jgi:hypothetical protein